MRHRGVPKRRNGTVSKSYLALACVRHILKQFKTKFDKHKRRVLFSLTAIRPLKRTATVIG
jgi:hypothetical protein